MITATCFGYSEGSRLSPSCIGCYSPLSALLCRVFLAALYRYAKTKQVSVGFLLQTFSTAWQPKLSPQVVVNLSSVMPISSASSEKGLSFPWANWIRTC